MSTISLYIWPVVIVSWVACGSSENKPPDSGPSAGDRLHSRCASGSGNVRSHSQSGKGSLDGTAEDSTFTDFWTLFAHAVRQRNTQLVANLTKFPLMGARACYLPHNRIQDPKQDTVGIARNVFDSLYSEIFDSHVSRHMSAGRSENDSILIWQGAGAVGRLISKNSDNGSPIYGYHIEYVENSREGGRYFLFARFDGHYRLAAILCDGMLR